MWGGTHRKLINVLFFLMFSTETREEAIIRLHLKGFSNNRINTITKIRVPRIKATIDYYYANGLTIPTSPTNGRPKKDMPGMLTIITALTIQNRVASAYSISQTLFANYNFSISPATINRRRHQLGFSYKPPKVKQRLTEIQKENRKKFAYSMLNSNIDFDRLIFSDESRFCLDSDNQLRWLRKGDTDDGCFALQDKFTCSVMVFGAIGIDYKSKLVVCSGNVDAVEYRDIITKSGLYTDLNTKYGAGNFIFVQDGAPCHTSNISTAFIQKRMSFLKNWPANSPDLNPIEHIWGAIKRILKTKKITTRQELIDMVNEIWNNFPQEAINRLIQSFDGRLRTVLDANGESISDILRSSIHHVPSSVWCQVINPLFFDDLVAVYDPTLNDNTLEFLSKRPWSYEEVQQLITLVGQFGRKWNIVASRMVNRTSISCANKYKSLVK